jgi:serine O-acetyltransferase
MKLISIYRLSHYLYQKNIPVLPKLLYYIQFLLYNSSLPPSVQIGSNTIIAYGGIGIVVHGRSIIGSNCLLGQGITIGGTNKRYGVPIIGNNVYINSGARIIGDIKIGDNVIIGANAVVIKDIPANSLAVGVPAKVIKSNIDIKDYV